MSSHDQTVVFDGRFASGQQILDFLKIAYDAAPHSRRFKSTELHQFLQTSPAQALGHEPFMYSDPDNFLLVGAKTCPASAACIFEVTLKFDCISSRGFVGEALYEQADRLNELVCGPALLSVTDHDLSPGSDEAVHHLHLGPTSADRAKAVTDRLFADIESDLLGNGLDLSGVRSALTDLEPQIIASMERQDAESIAQPAADQPIGAAAEQVPA